jgi:dTDP-4-dehydrorhamnose reductase
MPGALLPNREIELWAGIECTVNRVQDGAGDRYVDQLELSGHAARDADLDLLAWLGVPVVRYPVLWERVAPDGLDSARWDWVDRRLSRLRELGIRPIAGLLHHGSGPPSTSLLDPGFPQALARYARAVAERHPWVTDWTPVNEPLTTARFTTMYGHWHPHRRSFPDFVRAVVNQCRAVALAMAEIRSVVPGARLIQTEDVSRISSTPALAERAELDRGFRRLSLDLLCGLIGPEHPLWRDLLAAGADERELRAFRDDPCRVDLIGLNTYVTSDRFLDDRLERYPPALHGGDGTRRYVDVEAARVAESALAGHAALLEEAWQRYGRPLAITEVHLGCTRDEQLRWFAEAWTGARAARQRGADVRAVTAWSLLGSFGWERLVVDDRGAYEPGLYDLRAPEPRPTALAHAVRALAHGRAHDSPALDAPGWWRRPERVLFPAPVAIPPASASPEQRPIVVTGAGGTLGQALGQVCARRGLRAVLLTRRELDVTDREAIDGVLERLRPWAVINAAGYVRVDEAERDPDRCWRENVTGAVTVAAAAHDVGARAVTFSSDLVFDGRSGSPYDENATPRPLSTYGRSKAVAEELVLTAVPDALVVRTAAFFGPWDPSNFVTVALETMSAGRTFAAAHDLTVSPTYVPDLADAVLDLLLDGAQGIWHVVNQGAVSWFELARRAADAAGLGAVAGLLCGVPARALNLRAPRPAYSALATVRGQLPGDLDQALASYAAAVPAFVRGAAVLEACEEDRPRAAG